MKPNIDLTENQDFRKKGVFSTNGGLARLVRVLSGGDSIFGWSYDSQPYISGDDLVPTGTGYHVKRMKQMKQMDEGTMCLKCGADMSYKPWQDNWGLCTTCDAEMERTHTQRFDWEEVT